MLFSHFFTKRIGLKPLAVAISATTGSMTMIEPVMEIVWTEEEELFEAIADLTPNRNRTIH